ncbi:MAG: hypothetical protein AB1898_10315 [Acidobacteriota bacterium]
MYGAKPSLDDQNTQPVRTTKLLVVQAEARDQRLITEAIASADCEVVFRTALNDLDLIKAEQFNALVINLLDVSGSALDVIGRIKECSPTTEVILISRSADEALWLESIQRGAYECLSSPLDSKELRRIVLNALERNRPA